MRDGLELDAMTALRHDLRSMDDLNGQALARRTSNCGLLETIAAGRLRRSCGAALALRSRSVTHRPWWLAEKRLSLRKKALPMCPILTYTSGYDGGADGATPLGLDRALRTHDVLGLFKIAGCCIGRRGIPGIAAAPHVELAYRSNSSSKRNPIA